MKRVALMSRGPYKGKTTTALALAENGYRYADHGRTVIHEFVEQYNATHEFPTTYTNVKRNKSAYRAELQEFGYRLTETDQIVLVKKTLGEWLNHTDEPIVFESIRYPIQYDVLEVFGFRLVEVTCSMRIQRSRAIHANATLDQLEAVNTFESNQLASLEAEGVLVTNNDSPGQLAQMIMQWS